MTHYEQCCARECPDGCGKGLKIHGYTSPSSGGALKDCKYCFYNDGKIVAHHHNKKGAILCTAPTLAEFAERCAEALEGLVKGLPDKCSCHEAYTEREKNLGYRFKDPNCMFCEYEDEIRTARRALGLEK